MKKGLSILENQIKEKCNKLTSQLPSISAEEQEWLDNGGGNTVEELYAIDALEKSSDYGRGYDRLGDKYKAGVQRLRELAGDILKVQAKSGEVCDPLYQF